MFCYVDSVFLRNVDLGVCFILGNKCLSRLMLNKVFKDDNNTFTGAWIINPLYASVFLT